MLLSLYLHFPFCKRKCSYCDFCSAVFTERDMETYCEALAEEIGLRAQTFGGFPVDTVFLGGGTPSVVPARLMREVLHALRTCFTVMPNAEWTSEANPGTLTDEWLDVLTDAGCNRLSIGVQAAQEPLLRRLGRIHTYPQALEALAMARRHDIGNLNADAMFGLPGQTLRDYLETLEALAQTGVTHISAYSLILEEGTPLYAAVRQGQLTLPEDDATADMMEQGIRLLETLGYRRYEISNFAQPGFECRHNLGYWQQKPYLGFGVSAASLLPYRGEDPDVRYLRSANPISLSIYRDALQKGALPEAEIQPIGRDEAMFESVMLGLRMTDGIAYADFERMHGVSLRAAYGDVMDRLTAQGLAQPAQAEHPRLALTTRGLALQNVAARAFMR
ncbi:MAG TPA: radical SAM family heme chaperone HemW [Candidatus Limiplasma sp.]|nr:radical SAM family heme chaperone HemW [Candidatus Limiplasma sp.]HPS81686.1 radical SAM family heme chaperone HemW [Candidatus Limiplasma sp.]